MDYLTSVSVRRFQTIDLAIYQFYWPGVQPVIAA
jgi:hypothetical protein